jgi:hypothetical protein
MVEEDLSSVSKGSVRNGLIHFAFYARTLQIFLACNPDIFKQVEQLHGEHGRA